MLITIKINLNFFGHCFFAENKSDRLVLFYRQNQGNNFYDWVFDALLVKDASNCIVSIYNLHVHFHIYFLHIQQLIELHIQIHKFLRLNHPFSCKYHYQTFFLPNCCPYGSPHNIRLTCIYSLSVLSALKTVLHENISFRNTTPYILFLKRDLYFQKQRFHFFENFSKQQNSRTIASLLRPKVKYIT